MIEVIPITSPLGNPVCGTDTPAVCGHDRDVEECGDSTCGYHHKGGPCDGIDGIDGDGLAAALNGTVRHKGYIGIDHESKHRDRDDEV